MNKPKEQLCCLGYLITVTNKWKANFLNKSKYNTKNTVQYALPELVENSQKQYLIRIKVFNLKT